jgi:hypothetical protein
MTASHPAEITQEAIEAFAAGQWAETGKRSPIVVAVWYGAATACYLIENAEYMTPDALEFLASTGRQLRQNGWAKIPYKQMDDTQQLEDIASRMERASAAIREMITHA